MLKKQLFLALLAVASIPALAQAPDDLALVCEGVMKGNWKVGSDGALVLGPNGQWVSGSGSTMRYAEVPTQAELRIKENVVELYLPQPPSCGLCTGETGWREVKDFEATEDRFTGRIRYGLLSGTDFVIDRRTGRMTSKNGFDGTCRAVDLSERKF